MAAQSPPEMPGIHAGSLRSGDQSGLPASEHWDIVIGPSRSGPAVNFREVWRYRDLLLMFVRRDFVAFYKQTVLGPLLFFVQPIVMAGIFMFIFGSLAGLSTDGLPQPVFYLTGILCWSYFADCLVKTSTVFRDNAHIFGKIYFPRLIMPLSVAASSLARFVAQAVLLAAVAAFFAARGAGFAPSWYVLAVPLLIALIAAQGLGLGLIVSALTTKYRDLAIFLSFGVQLLMYATPVVYPLSALSGTVATVVALNPMAPIIEGMRKGLFGQGTFDLGSLGYAVGASALFLAVGILTYNRVERDFVDTL